MGQYFKPLRRKNGVLTLGLACALVLVWVRSFRTEDYFDVCAGRYSIGPKQYYSLWSGVSASGSLYVGRIWGQPEDYADLIGVESYYRYPRWQTSLELGFPSDELRYVWRFCGFGVYERGPDDPHNGGWRVVIPYGFVAVPLTLLSAWLLLSKPRQPKQTTEPPV